MYASHTVADGQTKIVFKESRPRQQCRLNMLQLLGWFELWTQYPGSVVPLAMFLKNNKNFNLKVSLWRHRSFPGISQSRCSGCRCAWSQLNSSQRHLRQWSWCDCRMFVLVPGPCSPQSRPPSGMGCQCKMTLNTSFSQFSFENHMWCPCIGIHCSRLPSGQSLHSDILTVSLPQL